MTHTRSAKHATPTTHAAAVAPNTPATHCGFVLPVALLLLAISCAALGSASYHSGRLALLANERQSQLMLKWTGKAAADAYMENAEDFFTAEEGGQLSTDAGDEGSGNACKFWTLNINGLKLNCLLRDEQALANMNTLWSTRDKRSVLEAVVRLKVHDNDSDLRSDFIVTSYAVSEASTQDGEAEQTKNFDHYFEYDSIKALYTVAENQAGSAVRLSCWGDGKLNVMRADEQVLKVIFAGVLTQSDIASLLQLRRSTDTDSETEDEAAHSPEQIAAALELDEKVAEKFLNLATTQSSTFSLTLEAEAGSNTWRRMYVQNAADGEAPASRTIYQW